MRGCIKGFYLSSFRISTGKRLSSKAIAIAKENNLLGNGILSKEFDFDIDLRIGAGSYVCGEETP
ncbi:MAG: hypothetical protein Ct9H90mP13_08900 [Pseudomonadota bacterium]|nr:MAG: hypothetical protein Ct9H90mP13_08900 [Pseudomonadota bacterium]